MTSQFMVARTLVIGLGDVVEDTLTKITQQFAQTHALDHLSVIWLRSTDGLPLPVACPTASGNPASPRRWHCVEKSIKDDLSRLYYDIDVTRIWSAPHWKHWTWAELRSNRVYGKLWIQHHLMAVKTALLADSDMPETVQGAILTKNVLSVFIVVPLIDPFASGAWLDVAYLLLDHFGVNSGSRVRVSGILLLPTDDQDDTHINTVSQNRAFTNALSYAALRELRFVLQKPSFFRNYHPSLPLDFVDMPPFPNGDCFVLGGSRNEHDDVKLAPRQDTVNDHCAKIIHYTACGTVSNLAPGEQIMAAAEQSDSLGSLTAQAIESIFPRIPYHEISDVHGIASMGLFQNTETFHENDTQQAGILRVLIDQVIGDDDEGIGSPQEQAHSALRMIEEFEQNLQTAITRMSDQQSEQGLMRAIDNLQTKATPFLQDRHYQDALQALNEYEIRWDRELAPLLKSSQQTLQTRNQALIKDSPNLRQLIDNLRLVEVRIDQILKARHDEYESVLRSAEPAIANLQADRARRYGFGLQAAMPSLYRMLINVFMLTAAGLFLLAGWLDIERLAIFIGGALVINIYGTRARPEHLLQTQISTQQQNLLRLQKRMIEVTQQRAFWQQVARSFHEWQIPLDGDTTARIGVAEVQRLSDTALHLRRSLDRDGGTSSEGEARKQRIESEWESYRQPTWEILSTWLKTNQEPNALERAVRSFALNHRLIEVDQRTLDAALDQLMRARTNAACLLHPQDRHPSFPAHLHSLNDKTSGNGVVLRSGFVHVKTGAFLPIPLSKFNGDRERSTLTLTDLPYPLDEFRAAALRVRGGIPLASLADIETWHHDYARLASFVLDAVEERRIRQRAFFHPNRAALAVPDLMRSSEGNSSFPYMALVAALLRYNRDPKIWERLVLTYDLKMGTALATVTEDDVRIPLNLDELCCAFYEKLTDHDTVLIDKPHITLLERPSRWTHEAEIVLASHNQSEDDMRALLQVFLRRIVVKRPTETAADWEAWVLNLFGHQIAQKPTKEIAQQRQRYLIFFAYSLLHQIYPLNALASES